MMALPHSVRPYPSYSGCKNQWFPKQVCQTFVPLLCQTFDKGDNALSYGWRKSELNDLCSHARRCPPQPSSGFGLGTKLANCLSANCLSADNMSYLIPALYIRYASRLA